MPGSISKTTETNEDRKFVSRSSDSQVAIAVDTGVTINGGNLGVTLYDEGGIPVEVDNVTHSLQTVDYEHHEIHEGNHFRYCDYELSKSNGSTLEFVFVTADTDKLVHLTFYVYSSGGATLELYAGASGINGGTVITPRNSRADSTTVSGVVIIKDPASISSDGFRTDGYLAGAGRKSGFVSRSNEIILARNATYLVRITSLANSNNISWCAEWYEHTDKD